MSEPPERQQTEQGHDADECPPQGGAVAVRLYHLSSGVEFFFLFGLDLAHHAIHR